MSVSGGLHTAFSRMERVGAECLQVFTRNQRQWKAPPLNDKEINLFRLRYRESGRPPVASHASYLINLGTWKEELAEKSVAALAEELDRCHHLSIPWVVIHPGSHGGKGIQKGIERVIRNLDQAFERSGPGNRVGILLETVAGQGTAIGSTFQELSSIINGSSFPSRLGVCVDTCHIFSAGYDISSKKAYEKTKDEIERTIGLEKVRLFHLNDSQKGLGARIDRHEHIGKGRIGLSGFSLLLNDPLWAEHPMILETPKGKEQLEDIENLKVLRSLLK